MTVKNPVTIEENPFIRSSDLATFNSGENYRAYKFMGAIPAEIFGDSTNRKVRFKDGKTPAMFKGKPVVLKIDVKDSHIYSFKFE